MQHDPKDVPGRRPRYVAVLDVPADHLRVALEGIAVGGPGGEGDLVDVGRPLPDIGLAQLEQLVLAARLADVSRYPALLEPAGGCPCCA